MSVVLNITQHVVQQLMLKQFTWSSYICWVCVGVREQPRPYQSVRNACLARNEHSYSMELKEKESTNIQAQLSLNKVQIFDC